MVSKILFVTVLNFQIIYRPQGFDKTSSATKEEKDTKEESKPEIPDQAISSKNEQVTENKDGEHDSDEDSDEESLEEFVNPNRVVFSDEEDESEEEET